SSFAAFSGTLITGFVSKRLSSFIAMSLLTVIGLWMIAEPYVRKDNGSPGDSGQENGKNVFSMMMKPEHADRDHSKHIDFKEATVLGVALSINNIGGGI